MAKVTVLMPVFNSSHYLRQAIQSILGQTFVDFDFLIVDDGSTDGSQEIVKSFHDSRIQLVQNPENSGVAVSLNLGIKMAQTKYIARMDGDDISEPTRLAKQIAFLEKKSSVGICGSWVRTLDQSGKGHVMRFPKTAEAVRAYILYNNPLAHPAVMMRRQFLTECSLFYDESCEAGQDYEFWSRCSQRFAIENIAEPLLIWRLHQDGVTHQKFSKSNATAMLVQQQELQRLGICIDNDALLFHRIVGNGTGFGTLKEVQKARRWLEMLLGENEHHKIYSQSGLQYVTAMVWFRLCLNSSGIGVRILPEIVKAKFCKHYLPPMTEITYLLVNCFFRFRSGPAGKLLGSN